MTRLDFAENFKLMWLLISEQDQENNIKANMKEKKKEKGKIK